MAFQTFSECDCLWYLDAPFNLLAEVTLPRTMYDRNGNEYITLPSGTSESIYLTGDLPETGWFSDYTYTLD